jgi:hypothetical protein
MGFDPVTFGRHFVRVINAALRRIHLVKPHLLGGHYYNFVPRLRWEAS